MSFAILLGLSAGFFAGLFEGLRASALSGSSFVHSWLVVDLTALVGALLGALAFGVAARIARLPEPARSPGGALRRLSRPIDLIALALVLTLVGLAAQRGVALVLPQGGELWRASAGLLIAGLVATLALRWTATRSTGLVRAAALVGTLAVAFAAAEVRATGDDPVASSVLVHDRGAPTPFEGVPPGRRSQAAAPNVLMIVLDTVRADHLSLYGYPRPTSPFLEQLARESTVYTHAISTAPWTLPSHGSLFTGLHPSVHQASTEHRLLRSDRNTLAELLRASGYATAGFSCNSIVSSAHNLHQGFEDFYELFRLVDYHRGGEGHVAQGALERSLLGKLWERVRPDPGPTQGLDKGARLVNQLVPAWLDRLQETEPGRPFFVFVNFLEPHLPYGAPQPYGTRFLDGPVSPDLTGLLGGQWLRELMRLIGEPTRQTPELIRQMTDLYDGGLAYQDAMLGELIGEVRARGLLDDTLVVVLADHGENLGEHHGLFDHTLSIHQSLLHVPLLIRYPRQFQPGVEIDAPVSTAGVFATLLAAADIPCELDPAPAPALPLHPGDPTEPYVVSEYSLPVFELGQLAGEALGFSVTPFAVRQRSIQTNEWKLIQPYPGPALLYDLTLDPGEQHPLPAKDGSAADELSSRLRDWIAAHRPPRRSSGDEIHGLDEATRQALEALGYAR